MNLKYKIKKIFLGFWQKYGMKAQLKIASKLLFIFLIVWIAGSSLTILSQWAHPGKFDGSPLQEEYSKYYWSVILELVSGYDEQPKELALNPASKVISVIVLVTGIIIFAIFTGQIVSVFIHVLQRLNRLPEKPENLKFNRPIIICGTNNKLDRIICELRNNPLSKGREIVIVDNEADKVVIKNKDLYKDVWCVKGNRANRDIFSSALGNEMSSAIILARESNLPYKDRRSDAGSIETALAIESYRETNHTVLELNDERNIPHLIHTRINEWIPIFEYANKLVSQTALQHGMTKVYQYLLGGQSCNEKTNRIFFTSKLLPCKIIGLTYEKTRKLVISNTSVNITLIGFAKFINKSEEHELQIKLRNTRFLKQLNPVNRICRHCGTTIYLKDQLGRTKKKCNDCFKKEKQYNPNASNPWLFPRDTVLKEKDQLVYLAEKEFDFNQL